MHKWLCREEEVYDREEVLGRDVGSVFPTRAKEGAAKEGGMDAEAIREMLGGRKFVTESEVCARVHVKGAS